MTRVLVVVLVVVVLLAVVAVVGGAYADGSSTPSPQRTPQARSCGWAGRGSTWCPMAAPMSDADDQRWQRMRKDQEDLMRRWQREGVTMSRTAGGCMCGCGMW